MLHLEGNLFCFRIYFDCVFSSIVLLLIISFVALHFMYIPQSVTAFVKNMIREVMEHRIKTNTTRNDLFQYFMKKGSESDDLIHEMNYFGITFFLESFETSAMTASRALYALALNQEVQQRLYLELKNAFGDKFDPSFDTISDLSYLNNVIQESQRMYPNLFLLTRVCTKETDLDIDGKSVKVYPGTPVVIPVYSIQKDSRYFYDPEKFDPERFNEEEISRRPSFTFAPFGGGPRICPGMKLGLTQVKLLVANIVFNYKIVKTKNTPTKLTFTTGAFAFISIPQEQEWVKILRRI